MNLSSVPPKDVPLGSEASLPEAHSWAVAWTVSHGEYALEEYLQRHEVPCFFPRINKRRIYKSGLKKWSTPLFPGYVFYDFMAIERHRVLESKKVAQILQPGDPEQLKRELLELARAIQADANLKETRFGQAGRLVYIARGPLKGLHGELLRLGSESRLILKVSFLGKAVEMAVDEAYAEPVI